MFRLSFAVSLPALQIMETGGQFAIFITELCGIYQIFQSITCEIGVVCDNSAEVDGFVGRNDRVIRVVVTEASIPTDAGGSES